MPEVWQLTLNEFIGDIEVEHVDDEEIQNCNRIYGYEVSEATVGWLARTLRPIKNHSDLFFADIRHQPLDVALIQLDQHGEYTVVGGYTGPHLWIDGGSNGDKGVRRRHIAPELVLAKAEKVEGAIEAESFTPAGYKAHAWAHYLAVKRAKENGHRVPAVVLADYPDLLNPKTLFIGPNLDYKTVSRDRVCQSMQARHTNQDYGPAP